jgi:isocitrate dehydrogenase kinase/phosphatase
MIFGFVNSDLLVDEKIWYNKSTVIKTIIPSKLTVFIKSSLSIFVLTQKREKPNSKRRYFVKKKTIKAI